MEIAAEIEQLEILLAKNSDEQAQGDIVINFLKKGHSIVCVQSLSYFSRLLQLSEKSGSLYHHAWGLYFNAVYNYFTGEYNTAQHLTQQAIILFEQLNEREGLADAYDNMGSINERTGEYDGALQNHFDSLKIRQKLGNKLALADSYNNIGVVYQLIGNYPEALKNHITGLEIRDEIGDERGKNASYINIGLIHSNNGNYPEALKSYFNALERSELANDKKVMADASNNIGAIYLRMGNYEEALKNHLKTLGLRKEIGDNYGMGMAYRNIGVVHQMQGDFSEAMANHLLALRIREEAGDKKGIADSHHAIGDINQRKGDLSETSLAERVRSYEAALENYQKALKIGESLGDKKAMAYYYNSIGEIYQRQGIYTEAIKNKLLSLKLGESVGDQSIIKECFVSLANSYKSIYDFENALEYYERYHELEKRILGEQTQRQITNLSFQHNLEQREKEAEIERLKNVELKEALEKLRMEKLRSELLFQNQVQELQSNALQAQMNPHFVFNSLNAIQQFIWKKSPEEATAYLSRFSKLIRIVLDNSRNHYVSLDQDLTALEYYIELEALRFEKKFEYRIICDPTINKKEIQLPPMIIQPLVENAIVHGLQPLKTPGKLIISLLRKANNVLHIIIEDNGVGRIKSNQIKIGTNKSHHSIAMQLTKERLQKMNDTELAEGAIVIMDLYNEQGEPAGTKVEINVPVEFPF